MTVNFTTRSDIETCMSSNEIQIMNKVNNINDGLSARRAYQGSRSLNE